VFNARRPPLLPKVLVESLVVSALKSMVRILSWSLSWNAVSKSHTEVLLFAQKLRLSRTVMVLVLHSDTSSLAWTMEV
jgi:hypothetical protein